jgi:sirohydrochlorin ferrochelatase
MNSTEKPTLIAVAHGTRDRDGLADVTKLVDLVRAQRPELRVQLCWLELAIPSLADVLAAMDGPVVVVPVLLSTGYHVKVDITAIAAGRPHTSIAAQLGPDARITQVVSERLRAATTRAGQGEGNQVGVEHGPRRTILIGAGSSDPQALIELNEAARQLEQIARVEVEVGQLTDESALSQTTPGTLVANYLLARGYFNDRLHRLATERLVVADPIGAHPLIAAVILDRYDAAVSRSSATN